MKGRDTEKNPCARSDRYQKHTHDTLTIEVETYKQALCSNSFGRKFQEDREDERER